MAQIVKSLPAMQETWIWSLDQEDPLEEEMATHSNILAWRIPWTEEPGRLQPMGSQRVRQDWVTNTHKDLHGRVLKGGPTAFPNIWFCFFQYCYLIMGFPGGLDGKESACNAEDPCSIPGLGRSPGEGNGNLPLYSCLENLMKKPWVRKESCWHIPGYCWISLINQSLLLFKFSIVFCEYLED